MQHVSHKNRPTRPMKEDNRMFVSLLWTFHNHKASSHFIMCYVGRTQPLSISLTTCVDGPKNFLDQLSS